MTLKFPVNNPRKLSELFIIRRENGPMRHRMMDYAETYSRGCKSWEQFIARIQTAIKIEEERIRASGALEIELVDDESYDKRYREKIAPLRPLYALLLIERMAIGMASS